MFSQALIDVSVSLIVAGLRTFNQVPNTIKPSVKSTLEAIGLGTDGKPLPQSE
ncbi:CD1375 family protein [Paenibacillus sp. NRS-1760]|uniref:CD1375 family protein n=1 Tax=Paenibacillus sp. NRS-1760 TaxID=3233902 RepID=UPI003D27CFD8